jgi:hypothetical protein
MVVSQKKVIKKIETQATEIAISTEGLDDFVLENSTSKFIEIFLFAANSEEQHILYKEEFNFVKIQFQIPENNLEAPIFRKFITKRLHRASAIIKVPKNKVITLYGDAINIESKSYQGDLKIFIEKGILKLHKVQANLLVTNAAGNLYAAIKKATIRVASQKGKIKINNILVSNTYHKKEETSDKNIIINTFQGNIFLTTK